MSSSRRPFLVRLLRVFAVFALLCSVVAAFIAGRYYWRVRQSMPLLDGSANVPGMTGPVQVERDALGVPTITGPGRVDVARALGFVHAQDRFFQMDLLRRNSAGELAGIVGAAAVGSDSATRVHRFRNVAQKIVSRLPPAQRDLLRGYTEGVNAGLRALGAPPWEYHVLRVDPAPWQEEDTVLVIFSMWLDLQDSRGRHERAAGAVREALGEAALLFFSPPGSAWDAALDGSSPPAPPMPPAERPALMPTTSRASGSRSPVRDAVLREPASEGTVFAAAERFDGEREPGSNNWAVDGRHTPHGSAMMADDMHLGLGMPNTWYRAALQWSDGGNAVRVEGVTLPGAPIVVVGSNGRVAWGFTNSYIDTVDVVRVEAEPDGGARYRRGPDWIGFAEHPETIDVKGAEPVTLVIRETAWGPVTGGAGPDGQLAALRWSAHDPEATDFGLLGMETAGSVDEAIAVAHASGMPNQNIVVADAAGRIAWTLSGRIPRRRGFDGALPVSWAGGDKGWDGWLQPGEVPVVRDPGDGLLWTANNRVVGGAALAMLGDGGYALGARARQIRDDLRALAARGNPMLPKDLLGVQLDDRAVFLARWKELLLDLLSDKTIAARPRLAVLRAALQDWTGHADVSSTAYRAVRTWRSEVARRVLEPIFAPARVLEPDLRYTLFRYEDALWRMLKERPVRVLGVDFRAWDDLLLDAAVAVVPDEGGVEGKALPTWGERNTLRMRHPLSRFLPAVLARRLDAPEVPLPGDGDMPRVQGPAFGASERMIVAPGHEAEGILHLPGGQCAHPFSRFHLAGHESWVRGEATPFQPGPAQHRLSLLP